MVTETFADLTSQFLLLPRGSSFLDYGGFSLATKRFESRLMAFGSSMSRTSGARFDVTPGPSWPYERLLGSLRQNGATWRRNLGQLTSR